MKAEEIIRALRLFPLPHEGGYFVETHRAHAQHDGQSLSTAIYYMLTPKTFSAIHRLKADEVWHFYLGDPVELLLLRPGGVGETLVLGADLAAGMRPQIVVPKGVWQGARLKGGGPHGFALMGTTMSPGFTPAEFILAKRGSLAADYPAYAGIIRELTRA